MEKHEFTALMDKIDRIVSTQLPELMTPKEVASYMKVHLNTVQNMMDEPDFIPVIKIGRQNRFRRTDVQSYIENSARRFNLQSRSSGK